MTIVSKNSRKVIVNGNIYRWVISPNDGFIVFVAELYEAKGRRLEVYIDSNLKRLWVDFPNVNIEDHYTKVIKPKEAEQFITQALEKGWNPKEKGAPIVFDMVENFILINRKQ